MNKLLKQMLLVCGCLFTLTGQAIADSLSDAKHAYSTSDFSKAAKLFRPLAEQGNVYAQHSLGMMYADGHGVSQDDTESVKWYRKAAIKGHAPAQNNLGLMYSQGRGAAQNYTEALKWYKEAIKKSYAPAQNNLAMMYYLGQGVPQNYLEAARLNRLAASQGYAISQGVLGVEYYEGKGVQQDYVLSHMWLNIASVNTSDIQTQKMFTGLRDDLAKVLTTRQIAEAQELARKCTANKFKGC